MKTTSGYAAHSVLEGIHTLVKSGDAKEKNAYFTRNDGMILFNFSPDAIDSAAVGNLAPEEGELLNKRINFIYSEAKLTTGTTEEEASNAAYLQALSKLSLDKITIPLVGYVDFRQSLRGKRKKPVDL